MTLAGNKSLWWANKRITRELDIILINFCNFYRVYRKLKFVLRAQNYSSFYLLAFCHHQGTDLHEKSGASHFFLIQELNIQMGLFNIEHERHSPCQFVTFLLAIPPNWRKFIEYFSFRSLCPLSQWDNKRTIWVALLVGGGSYFFLILCIILVSFVMLDGQRRATFIAET